MKSKIVHAALAAVIALAVVAILAVGLSWLVYGRSLRASLYELSLRRRFATKRTAQTETERLEKLRGEPEKLSAPPSNLRADTELAQFEREGMTVYALNGHAGGDAVVLYLHGGAYINSFNAYQWQLMERVARGADCRVIAPAYHLAPWADYRRAYDDLFALYGEIQAAKPDARLILMGDSAGGGLALGLAEYLAQRGAVMPERLILFSPWVDVSMDNPDIGPLVRVEPMLHLDLTIVHGRFWAGGADTHHWMVSPLYGDMAGLPPVKMYCGTRELLYPDILLARDRLAGAGVDVSLTVGRGLNHDYPLMPIPEADRAVAEVIALVRGSGA